ncbi:hypothetical protein [Propionicimonas sp.]|uniref:hypothetical protein n=1 Tax=Propionicimonas sp. TaxID=1955623 RepID=UPI0039E2D7DE
MLSYLLAESVFTVETTVDLIRDTRLDEPREYLDVPVTTVAQTVAGDARHGTRELDPPRRGDNDFTIAWTADRRLASVSYKSVGVASKLVAAAVKILATVVGIAIRGTATGLTRRSDPSDSAPLDEAPDPSSVRAIWDTAHEAEAAHSRVHAAIAERATAKLTTLRGQVVDTDDGVEAARALARISQLELVLRTSLKETAKVDAMFASWSDAHLARIPRTLSRSIALDAVPVHGDPTIDAPTQDPNGLHDRPDLEALWQDCGIWLEVGPTLADPDWRPNHAGAVDGATLRRDVVYWRVPRMARVWVWRRGDSGRPVLEKAADVPVTDRFGESTSMALDGRFFGEASVDVTFGDLGSPARLVVGDKSVAGAIADAIGGAPDQVSAGLDAATRIGASADALRDAADVRGLEVIKRQLERRSKELELQGVNATADSYAELKRLQQQVDIASAQGSLAPPSTLATLQNELAEATARRDLDAVNRDSAQAAELAGVRAEIARLQAQVQLLQARAQLPQGS